MLFPLLPIWRRFRELDGYSSKQCRAIVVSACVRFGIEAWPGRLAAAGAGVVMLLALGATGHLERDIASLRDLELGLMPTILLVWVGLPSFAAWVAGIMVRTVQARGALRRLLRVSHCPRCGYTLEGLRPIEPPGVDPNPAGRKVRCPECGKLWGMLELGITAIDLLPWEQRIPGAGVGKLRVRRPESAPR